MKNYPQLVDDKLYRSSAPLSKSDLAIIQTLGIKTIICLQEGWSWLGGTYRAEEDWEEMGGEYWTIGWSNFFPPTADDMELLYRLVESSPGNVLVHCKAGVDRTGMFSGGWLVRKMLRTDSEAWSYIKVFGMHWWYKLGWKKAFFRNAEALKKKLKLERL